MKKLTVLFCILLFSVSSVRSQGCIIVRNISGFSHYNFKDNGYTSSTWMMDITGRYFKSYKDYKGGTNLKVPKADQSINYVLTTDFTISKFLDNGWGLSLNIPVTSNRRSTTSEHAGAGKPRHETQSFGLGDARFTVYKWLLTPKVNQKGNVQFGLGIKFPTGDYRYQGYFYRKEDSLVLAPVNPSIQLGDGGTGITTELNTYYIINKALSLYGNFFYLINPRDQNGVSPLLGRAASAVDIKSGRFVNSVPDQYTARAGIDYTKNKISVSIGGRLEGIPVHDLVGGSDGNRRAGYNLSIEPGVIYSLRKISLSAYVPVMFKQATRQTVPDQIASKYTDTYTLLSGGFSDYLVFLGVSFKLNQ